MLGADKKNGTQRLLFDRRPLNAVEERLYGLPLPFPGDFVRFELGPEEVIRTSLRDGKDQYYIFRQDDARIQWQAFGQPARARCARRCAVVETLLQGWNASR